MIDKVSLQKRISDLYNRHHLTLTDELKTILIETTKVIDDKGNIPLAAMKLNTFLVREIRYYQLGINAPKELIDLYQLTAKSPIDVYLGRKD